MIKEVSQKAADHITHASYGASGGTAMFGFFELNDIALAVGIIATIATAILSHVYRVKHHEIALAHLELARENAKATTVEEDHS